MTTTPTNPRRRRRIWLWILTACFAPWLIIAAAAWSILTPARDLAVVRDTLRTGETAPWRTQVQFDLGSGSLSLARTVLRFVPHENSELVRAALAAVNRASVGVYDRTDGLATRPGLDAIAAAETKLRSRGWEILVKVLERDEAVLVCQRGEMERTGRFCVVVLDEENCVLVCADLKAEDLSQLVSLARRSAEGGIRL